MDEVLHANIFFFIASVATVVFCILVSLILYQILQITKKLRAIIDRIAVGSEIIAEDIAEMREFIKGGSGLGARVVQFFLGSRSRTVPRRNTRTKNKE